MSDPQQDKHQRWRPLQFTLRGLLLLALVTAAFMAGTMVNRPPQPAAISGDYTMILVGGNRVSATITHMQGDQFQLLGCGVLSGTYRLVKDRLVVTDPIDKRMLGLVWSRTGETWTLVAETPGTPTGSSYLGAKLTLGVAVSTDAGGL